MTAMTLQEAADHVIARDARFVIGRATIRGVDYPVFANAPASLRAMMDSVLPSYDNGSADFQVMGDDTQTYAEFCDQVDRIAAALVRDHGVTHGTPVGVAMRNCPEYMACILGIAAAGGVAVFLNAWWTTEELDYGLRDSGARLVFADAGCAAKLAPLTGPLSLTIVGVRGADTGLPFETFLAHRTAAQAPNPPIDTDDDFAIMYSSGTTGRPKGVVLTHRGAITAVMSWGLNVAIQPLMQDSPPKPPPRHVYLIITPLFHVVASHAAFLTGLYLGAKIVHQPKWDAAEAVRLIQDHGVTRFTGVPTQSADLMAEVARQDVDLPSLRVVGAGGAKPPPSQIEAMDRAFPKASVATGWGMTETNAIGIGAAGPSFVARPGSAGRLYPGVQALEIRDGNGQRVPNGEVGELTVKSAANMRCYLGKPEETAEVLRDGWLATGDLATVDDDGWVTIVDRKKDIIIRGGENIASLEVDAALHRHPDVMEAAAFSVPHDRLGETVGACIVTGNPELTAETLRQFLTDQIAYFKIPDHYWFQSQPLIRGATSKLDRRAIRAACLQEKDDR